MPIPTFDGPTTWALQAGGALATVAGHYGSQYLFGSGTPYIHTDDDDMPEEGHNVIITSEGRFGKRAKGQLGQRVPTGSEIKSHEGYWARYEQHKEYMRSHGGKRRKSTAEEGRSTDLRMVKSEPEDRADTDFVTVFRGTSDEHRDEHGSSRSGRTVISTALFMRGYRCKKWFDIVTTDTLNQNTFVLSGQTALTWTSDVTAGTTRFTKYCAALLPKDTTTTSSRYREADCVRIGGIELEGSAWATSTHSNATFLRIIIVQTRLGGHNNTDFADEVLDKNICNAGAGKLGVWNPVAVDNKYNYNILKDKVYKLEPEVANSFAPIDIKTHMKFKRPLEVIYGPTSWTTNGNVEWNEVKSNGLAVLAAACDYKGDTLSHTVALRMRLHFADGVV
jgi:hypothetical protein